MTERDIIWKHVHDLYFTGIYSGEDLVHDRCDVCHKYMLMNETLAVVMKTLHCAAVYCSADQKSPIVL